MKENIPKGKKLSKMIVRRLATKFGVKDTTIPDDHLRISRTKKITKRTIVSELPQKRIIRTFSERNADNTNISIKYIISKIRYENDTRQDFQLCNTSKKWILNTNLNLQDGCFSMGTTSLRKFGFQVKHILTWIVGRTYRMCESGQL